MQGGSVNMKDFSFWEEYEGASEGSGRSEKNWLQNPDIIQNSFLILTRSIDIL